MSQTTIRCSRRLLATVLLGIVGCATQRAVAGDHCFYKGTMFSDGAAACQAGTLYRCADGDWASSGAACPDAPITVSQSCQFSGISYSTGSSSCQAGTQFRCEDGMWRSLGTVCAVGDSPIRLVPNGRTCMYSDATVANNSTICKAGTTFLCSNGEWVSLGTACR